MLRAHCQLAACIPAEYRVQLHLTAKFLIGHDNPAVGIKNADADHQLVKHIGDGAVLGCKLGCWPAYIERLGDMGHQNFRVACMVRVDRSVTPGKLQGKPIMIELILVEERPGPVAQAIAHHFLNIGPRQKFVFTVSEHLIPDKLDMISSA